MAYLVDLADDIRRRSRPTAEDALVEWVEGERVWTAATLEPLSCPLPVDMATKPDDGEVIHQNPLSEMDDDDVDGGGDDDAKKDLPPV